MKRFLAWVGLAVLGLALFLAGLVTYISLVLPKVKPAENITVQVTPKRIERGRYLAKAVADCYTCHSMRDFTKYGGPVIAGSEFAGGEPLFDERIGLPGRIPPKNITPYNLKNYTDGQLIRVLRTGVRANGEPLFPMMPYQHYAKLSQEDLYSIIAYLRTLPERKNDVPEHRLNFPVNLIVRTMPKDAPAYPAEPDPKNTVEYGKYLVNAAACSECHTPVNDHHEPLEGMDFAGGQVYPSPDETMDFQKGGILRTPNLTPDLETGIGGWTKQQFVARFKAYRDKESTAKVVKRGEMNTLMPIYIYANMTDADLGAIYDYLHTLKAVKHSIERFSPAKI